MGKLSDILNGSGANFSDIWNSTQAASDFNVIPPGAYTCRATRGELIKSRHSTPGYQLEFTVLHGEFAGRRLWLDCWLTPAALPATKRDLAKLGITSPEQLERPLPRGIRCKVHVVIRRDDNGVERNRVRSFDVLGVDAPDADPFAPLGDAAEPAGEVDATFDPRRFDEGAGQ